MAEQQPCFCRQSRSPWACTPPLHSLFETINAPEPSRLSFFCPSAPPASFCHASFLGNFQLSTAPPDSDTGPDAFSNEPSIPCAPAKVATSTALWRRSSRSVPSSYAA